MSERPRHAKKATVLTLVLLPIVLGWPLAGCRSFPASDPVTTLRSEATTVDTGATAESTSALSADATPTPDSTPQTVPLARLLPAPATVELSDESGSLSVFREPDAESDQIGRLGNGVTVTVAEERDGWLTIPFLETTGYVSSDFMQFGRSDLEPYTEALYASLPSRSTVDVDDAGIESHHIDQLVDVRLVAPTVVIDLAFASDDNFAGQQLYPHNLCLLQAGTAERIREAQDLFQRDGYSLKLYDCYRPFSVTKILYDIIGNARYVAHPSRGSIHNRGAAVDATLVDVDGNELEMPSSMHTLDERANRENPSMSAQARENMDYMTEIMEACGMDDYAFEWWHFTDEDRLNYVPSDLDFTEIIMVDRPHLPSQNLE